MQLIGKKAIVTGGSQGIGKGIAIALAKAGADVVIQYHSAKYKAQEVVDQINKTDQTATAIQSDFTEEKAPELFIEEAIRELKTVDILVNCAAAYDRGPLLDLTAEQFAWMQKVNVEVPFRLIQAFVKHHIDRRMPGSIINISSISGLMPSIGSCLNSCSKAGLNMLTRSAALELAPYQIRVNSIAPGLVDTESNLDFKTGDPQGWQNALNEIPIGRVGQPIDCAQLAVFLASDDSSWITGAVIPIDGGMSISWRS